MRIRVFILSCIILGFVLVSCTRENGGPEEEQPISFIVTQSGGCNDLEFGELKTMLDEPDTLFFRFNGDTLDAFVGINYLCCAPFATETEISGDSIFMTIRDTCPNPMACYCKCMCYYTWNFLFTDVEERDYYYRVTLDSPLEEGNRVLWEGDWGFGIGE